MSLCMGQLSAARICLTWVVKAKEIPALALPTLPVGRLVAITLCTEELAQINITPLLARFIVMKFHEFGFTDVIVITKPS